MSSSSSLLPFFGCIKVTGKDAAGFLHNQLSNDIQNLPKNTALHACYNNHQGRVLANMLVVHTEAGFLLLLARDLCAPITQHLQRFVLRSKVLIEIASDAYFVAAMLPKVPITPSLEAYALTLPTEFKQNIWRIKLPAGGMYLLSEQASLLPDYQKDNAAVWQAQQIAAGYPWISAHTTATCVAQMLNLHILGAINFKKGCYPGQEIIARAQYRGKVKRGLATFTSHSPVHTGDSILDEQQQEVGIIINTAQTKQQTLALAVIKFAAHTHILSVKQQPIQLKNLFFTPDAANQATQSPQN